MSSECDSDSSPIYQIGTDWFSSTDQGLVLTLAINMVVFAIVLALYACFSRSQWLHLVYSPLADVDPRKHPLIKAPVTDIDPNETLEHTMMQRFFKMNTLMLSLFALFALPVLLPLYAVNVYDGMDISFAPPPPPSYPPSPPPYPPQLPGDPMIAEAPSMPPFDGIPPFSGIAALSIGHLPPGSPRFWASSLAMFIFTVIFLAVTRREMEVFISLRLKWLSHFRPQTYAARLVTYLHSPAPLGAGGGDAARPSSEEMMEALKPIFGDALVECLTVPRHPFWPGAIKKGLSVSDKATSGASGKAGAGKVAYDEFKMVALGEDVETSYILLFRTRAARFAAISSRTILTNATVGKHVITARAKPAVAPEDYAWKSLSTPRWIIVGAYIGTILFFVFWNVPIALIQSFASLESISKLMANIGLGSVRDWLFGLNSTATAILEGFFPTILLAVAVAVAYMIIPILSGMQGWESKTAIALSTQRKFFYFNFLVIILASCILGSLIETTDKILNGGTCVIFALLGNSIPSQADFWLNYLLQDALFLVPVIDILQLVPAAIFFFCAGCCACCKCGRCKGKCGPTGSLTLMLVKSCQGLKYFKLYGRLSIILTATLFFAAISPLILVIAIPWSIILARVWDHNHKRINRYALGVGFDTGGAYWALAMQQLCSSLMVSQLVLVAVHALNQSYGTAGCLLLLLFCTWFRFARMTSYYAPMAEELPLEECAKLDATTPADDTKLAEVSAAYQATFYGASKEDKEADAVKTEAV
eukprot:scaffold287848_cov33-Tisochrysis_lutea.AAC.1